jgi:hypothetical protein
MPGEESQLEIRPVYDAADFAESDPTGKHREREQQLRKATEARAK